MPAVPRLKMIKTPLRKEKDPVLDGSFTLTMDTAQAIGDEELAELHDSTSCLPKTKPPKQRKSKGAVKLQNPYQYQTINSVNGDLHAVRSSNLHLANEKVAQNSARE